MLQKNNEARSWRKMKAIGLDFINLPWDALWYAVLLWRKTACFLTLNVPLVKGSTVMAPRARMGPGAPLHALQVIFNPFPFTLSQLIQSSFQPSTVFMFETSPFLVLVASFFPLADGLRNLSMFSQLVCRLKGQLQVASPGWPAGPGGRGSC